MADKTSVAKCVDNILHYIWVLEHASTCLLPVCFEDCQKLKRTMSHARTCSQSECKSCTNLRLLKKCHVVRCKQSVSCPVDDCTSIQAINE